MMASNCDSNQSMTIQQAAWAVLKTPDPDEKLRLTFESAKDWDAGSLSWSDESAVESIQQPNRPVKPELVHPRHVPRRKLSTASGRAALVHAIAHIEFNAIHLAWDAVYRFRGMPREFYADWLSVASDEARHFQMLRQRLQELESDYGDFPAHNGLWEAAENTSHDPLIRMALVPRVLEARGLDVTPGMIEKLERAGDSETVSILEVILSEEIGHVAIGTRWFHFLCEERGLEPDSTFHALLTEHLTQMPRGPFNLTARRSAGFAEAELAALQAGDSS